MSATKSTAAGAGAGPSIAGTAAEAGAGVGADTGAGAGAAGDKAPSDQVTPDEEVKSYKIHVRYCSVVIYLSSCSPTLPNVSAATYVYPPLNTKHGGVDGEREQWFGARQEIILHA
jgi:hypothetical protein